MSSGFASHRSTASGNKRDARCLDNEEMLNTSRAATTTPVVDAVNVRAPSNTTRSPDNDPQRVSTNESALAAASATIEAFVRTLHYPQQRAVFQDNALRYLHAFADFYRESKTLLKTKDDPSYCPPSCRVTIPLQPTIRVRESMAFKALADESARIETEFSHKMAAQMRKCKYLNNADKKQESVEIYAKGLANMAEILLAELNTGSTTKHDLVADLLSNHEPDAIGHINMGLDRFIEIYKDVNKLPSKLEIATPYEVTHPPPPMDPHINQPLNPATQLPRGTIPPPPTARAPPPTLPNPYNANTTATTGSPATNTPIPATATTAHPPGFVTALNLLPPTANPPTLDGKRPATSVPNLPTPTQPTQTITNPAAATPNTNFDAITAFEEAFAYDITPPETAQPSTHPAQTLNVPPPNPPPLTTTLNPYSRGENVILYSREYTTQELEAIQLAEQSHHDAQARSRIAILNSLRSSGRTMTTNLSTSAHAGANDTTIQLPTTPIHVVHTNTRGDGDSSTLTGTGDGTTPSSRSTVSFHHALATGTHHGALHTLHTAIIKCFSTAQADDIRAFNAKAIEANLTKIAARQRTEECAESTAITINSEGTPTPRTVGATIDARIRRSQQELEKRLQSLEQRLANEKSKSASFERRLQQQQHHHNQQPTNVPLPATRNSAKDLGATMEGATAKKSSTTAQSTTQTPTKPRWTPPPTALHPKRPSGRGGRGNATPQNDTGRGGNRYAARARPKHRPTQTRYNAPKHPSA